jgi:phosphatidylinositol-3-phosphatase
MRAPASTRPAVRRAAALAASAGLLAASLAFTAGPAAAGGGAEGVPALRHVFLIIGENTQLSQLNKTNAPYLLNTLAPASAWFTNYWATTHYSESNYVAMTSGQFTPCQQKDGKASSCHQDVDNLFHQLYTAGRTFTTWSESMPSPCYLLNTGSDASLNHYAAKHNPQLFFDNVEGDAVTAVGSGGWVDVNTQGGTFCQSTNIATGGTGPNDMGGFNTALATNASTISDFNLVIPNECEDAHSNCKPAGNPILQFDAFLAREVPLIQAYIDAHGGTLIVTFDEGVTSSPKRAVKFGDGGNVAWLAWGPQVSGGTVIGTEYTHYSMLRTLEDGFGVSGYLGGAAQVSPITGIWK